MTGFVSPTCIWKLSGGWEDLVSDIRDLESSYCSGGGSKAGMPVMYWPRTSV
jgi:hypothetical protein